MNPKGLRTDTETRNKKHEKHKKNIKTKPTNVERIALKYRRVIGFISS